MLQTSLTVLEYLSVLARIRLYASVFVNLSTVVNDLYYLAS